MNISNALRKLLLESNSHAVIPTGSATTPVPRRSKGRKDGDAARFNDAAVEVLKVYPDIATNDLYAFTKANHAKWQARPGDVHYNVAGKDARGG